MSKDVHIELTFALVRFAITGCKHTNSERTTTLQPTAVNMYRTIHPNSTQTTADWDPGYQCALESLVESQHDHEH